MIDIHSHILPMIDDGPETTEQALSLVYQASLEGITAMAATPPPTAMMVFTTAPALR
ncbi:MAG: CpsB/CapC family capsule biosynthesis tyrosine phosphatase [Thermodesulfobacteriota bacterium]|nr:CpsB/CapC family capsule biosynthesis tyrosine phosphatase [Thermodesulfobacteriota bacterium]